MREQQRMLEAELSKWTGFDWEYRHGGKHTKIVIKVGERRRLCPFFTDAGMPPLDAEQRHAITPSLE